MTRSWFRKKAATRKFRPSLETIEARLVLSTLHAVPTALDGAAGSLRAAITTADNLDSGAVNILATPGTYHLTEGELPVDGATIAITSTGAGKVVIEASSGDRIFDVESGTLILNDVTLSGGHLDGADVNPSSCIIVGPVSPLDSKVAHPFVTGDVDDGAGAFVEMGATLVLDDCSLLNNYADMDGGAVENMGTLESFGTTFGANVSYINGGAIENMGTAVVVGSTFSVNSAGADGAAIDNEAAPDCVVVAGPSTAATPLSIDATLIVTGSKFDSNIAYEDGGAIENDNPAVVVGSVFDGNSAQSTGGAIDNEDDLVSDSSTFSNDSALDGAGGAIYNGQSLYVNLCGFVGDASGNGGGGSGDRGGGAIYNNGTLGVLDSTFRTNTVNDGYGGAIYNNGTLSIVGAAFDANYATYSGSAVADNWDSTAIISASTFLGNTSADDDGYAIDNGAYLTTGATLTLTNVVISGDDSGVDNQEYATLNLNACMIAGNSVAQVENDGTANVSTTFTTFTGAGSVNYNP